MTEITPSPLKKMPMAGFAAGPAIEEEHSA